jgi:Domain of unknown function (DUF4340)
MRRTLVYLAILAVLGTGIYYFLIAKHPDEFSGSDSNFSVTDTASVGKFFIADPNGKTILVERNDTCWLVNKQYKALPAMVKLILMTFTMQKTLYPVTKAAYNNVIKLLSTDGKKVEVYDRSGKKINSFYVGGISASGSGTNMLIEGSSTPYVVQVPGFNGYLSSRYSTDVADWRDRTVFNVPADQIKSVSVAYPDYPLNSFTITNNNNNLTVAGDPSLNKYLSGLNTRRVKVFLNYFTNINSEGYMNGIPAMDSTLRTTKINSIIDLTTTTGRHYHADIYWMPINRRSKNLVMSNPDVPDDYDADRLYAIINDSKDTVMIQQFVFKKLFRKAFEFFEKDDSTHQPHPAGQLPKNVMLHKNQ